MNGKISLGLCLAGTLLITGCARYLERTDTINSYSGDSVARNVAIHTINPTPFRARYRHIHHNGERMIDAVTRYENPPKPSQTTAPSASPSGNKF